MHLNLSHPSFFRICRQHSLRAGILTLLCSWTLPAALTAAATFGDGQNRIVVSGGYRFVHDSNLFANADGQSASSHNADVALELDRSAGYLKVAAGAHLKAARYNRFSNENYANPGLTAQVIKDQGRLTGSGDFYARRENQADASANVRIEAWRYGSALNLKYPINERYYFTSNTALDGFNYTDNARFVDRDELSQGFDVFYVLTPKLDLMAGYRARLSALNDDPNRRDHALTLGATGLLRPKLSATLRGGYQFRSGGPEGSVDSVTAAFSLVWTVSNQLTVTGQLSKDYGVISTGVSTDEAIMRLGVRRALGMKLSTSGNVYYARSKFLGPLGAGRVDNSPGADAALSYSFSPKFSSSVSHSYFRSSSTDPWARYNRHLTTVSLLSRF